MKYVVIERKVTLYELVEQEKYRLEMGKAEGTVELNNVQSRWVKENVEAFFGAQTFISAKMR